MIETLNHDEFEEHDEVITENYAPHNIVYGSTGWTDVVDDATIALLLRIGAIDLNRTITGVGFETRIYVSVKGTEPSQTTD